MIKNLSESAKNELIVAMCANACQCPPAPTQASAVPAHIEYQNAVTSLILSYLALGAVVGGYAWGAVRLWNIARPLWRMFHGQEQPHDSERVVGEFQGDPHATQKQGMIKGFIDKNKRSSKPVRRRAVAQLDDAIHRSRSNTPSPAQSRSSSRSERDAGPSDQGAQRPRQIASNSSQSANGASASKRNGKKKAAR